MLIHIVTNIFSNPLVDMASCSALSVMWMLMLLVLFLEYGVGRVQLATINYTYAGPALVVVSRVARWHMCDAVEQIEYHAWLWLNSRVIGA